MARGADHATCIENIDIGGPAMIRAASKNHRFVTVLTDPADYQALLDQMKVQGGATSLGFRQKLALTAFSRTAAYDAAVSGWVAWRGWQVRGGTATPRGAPPEARKGCGEKARWCRNCSQVEHESSQVRVRSPTRVAPECSSPK